MNTFFYVIVASYNAGDDLLFTYDSLCAQDYRNMVVLVQDGGSNDGSIEKLREVIKNFMRHGERLPLTAIVSARDFGIYDAMNKGIERAVKDAKRRFAKFKNPGCYALFMNCGDTFYGDDVLKKADDRIRRITEHLAMRMQINPKSYRPGICYGDTFDRMSGEVISAPEQMDDFACYRSMPCHQSCFYDLDLLEKERYDTSYRIRADYEHFLRLKYMCGADVRYLKMVVADYKGGGFSETPENKKCSEKERSNIIGLYLPSSRVLKYDMYRTLSLQPLRAFLSRNKSTAGAYNKLRSRFMSGKDEEDDL